MSTHRSQTEFPADIRRETLETIRELTAAGETDGMGGGVPMERLAEEIDLGRRSIKHHLTILREENKVQKVSGRCSDFVRPSYLPTEEGADTNGDREVRADGGPIETYDEIDTDAAEAALDSVADEDVVVRGSLEGHSDIWITIDPADPDRFLTVNPDGGTIDSGTLFQTRLLLKQRDRLVVVRSDSAPGAVQDAIEGRPIGQQGIADFGGDS